MKFEKIVFFNLMGMVLYIIMKKRRGAGIYFYFPNLI